MIRIGTRNSPLAMWQAKEVEQKLQNLGYETVLVPVLSSGDKNLNQPLYSLGITGVFTKDLDIALLNNEIDIAVHSLKEIPKAEKIIKEMTKEFLAWERKRKFAPNIHQFKAAHLS